MAGSTVEISDLGELLKVWRMLAHLTLADVAQLATDWLPGDEAISHELVRRYEAGDFPRHGPDPVTVAAITFALGRRTAELPAEHRGAVEDLTEKLLRNRCFPVKAHHAA